MFPLIQYVYVKMSLYNVVWRVNDSLTRACYLEQKVRCPHTTNISINDWLHIAPLLTNHANINLY